MAIKQEVLHHESQALAGHGQASRPSHPGARNQTGPPRLAQGVKLSAIV